MISIKLFIQQFQFHPTHFLSFFVLMRLTTFFIQQYVKMMSFYCNRMSYRISKIRISIRKQNKSCFVCQNTVSVQRWRTKTRRATAQLILLKPTRSSMISSLTMVYAPSSLLLLIHSLVFPRQGLSSSESISSDKTTG